jgi:hypothetical protein
VSAATCGHCGYETLTNPCYRCGTARVEMVYSVADGAARRELESRQRITRALAMLDGYRAPEYEPSLVEVDGVIDDLRQAERLMVAIRGALRGGTEGGR